MIKEIKHNGKVIAIIYRKNEKEETIHFLTDEQNNFQVALLNHKKGHVIPIHFHNPIKRNITGTDEMLYVEEGKMKVLFYSKGPKNKAKKIAEGILIKGDIVNLISEAHGFEFLEKSRIVYVKQGPYINKITDKKIL